MEVSNGVDQGVGPQDDARALRPLCAHQVVLAQQDFPYVFRTRDPDQGLPQEVGFEHVAMAFSA